MLVEWYLVERTRTVNVGNNLIIIKKGEYETYAANPENAKAKDWLWAYDFRRKFAENTGSCVRNQFYGHKPKLQPIIDEAIKVHKLLKHLGYLPSEDDLPLESEGG